MVTCCHFLSCLCHLMRVTSRFELKLTQNPSFRSSTATSRRLPVKLRDLRVTSGHVRSRDVISCHCECHLLGVTALQELKHTKPDFSTFYSHFQVTSGHMTSLPNHFRSREVTRPHFLSRECHLLRVTAVFELKHSQNPSFQPSTATSR